MNTRHLNIFIVITILKAGMDYHWFIIPNTEETINVTITNTFSALITDPKQSKTKPQTNTLCQHPRNPLSLLVEQICRPVSRRA